MNEQKQNRLKEAEKIAGLREHLEKVLRFPNRGSYTGYLALSDIQVDVEKQAAVYLVNVEQWPRQTIRGIGIEYSIHVGGYLNGKGTVSNVFDDIHREIYVRGDARLDELETKEDLHYTKIESFKIKNEDIEAIVSSTNKIKKFSLVPGRIWSTGFG